MVKSSARRLGVHLARTYCSALLSVAGYASKGGLPAGWWSPLSSPRQVLAPVVVGHRRALTATTIRVSRERRMRQVVARPVLAALMRQPRAGVNQAAGGVVFLGPAGVPAPAAAEATILEPVATETAAVGPVVLVPVAGAAVAPVVVGWVAPVSFRRPGTGVASWARGRVSLSGITGPPSRRPPSRTTTSSFRPVAWPGRWIPTTLA